MPLRYAQIRAYSPGATYQRALELKARDLVKALAVSLPDIVTLDRSFHLSALVFLLLALGMRDSESNGCNWISRYIYTFLHPNPAFKKGKCSKVLMWEHQRPQLKAANWSPHI